MTPACFSAGVTPVTQRSWSTTFSEVVTRRDLPERDEFVTRVLGVLANGSREVVFDETTPNPASSPEAQALFADAEAAVAAAGAASVADPELVDSADGSQTEHLGTVGNQTQASTTFTIGVGPTTILAGQDQSENLFVPAGCTNFNDNTHTTRFVDDQFQTTVTHSETYQIAGQRSGQTPAVPVVAAPRFTG